ncbi:TonB-dependent siderophore receptor [Pararobbsia silviterrae]|uniref:TonB-dependent siderophore receptor n=1 Tax=Pararobbsia silviterrae TaxID=1792498 RepID=A0A494X8R4_9BURK|nr:TonB-dependent siderophore receptor [Pararobbsia silviterrae]RKP47105.1 TonB-dependent siderophore receptor [Pararobbsia silviterrae]
MVRPRFRPAPLALALALACASLSVQAQDSTAGVTLSIAAQPLAQALNDWARQTSIELMVEPSLVAGKTAPAVSGRLTPKQALDRLLAGSGLVGEITGTAAVVRLAGTPLETLPTVAVTSERDSDATTEGSGSYASKAATITGKTPEKLQEIPNSISVITRQRMDDQNMATLQDALQYATGVKAVSYGDSAYYTARGYNLGIEYNGVSVMNGIQYQPQLDLAFYDRVEVFRGPLGVIDGAGNPGGTVNLVRKEPLDTFHVSTETQLSSFGGARQVVDVTGPLNKDGTLRGRAVIVGSDEHQSIDRYRKKEAGFYGILEYDIDPRTTLSFSVAHQVNADSDYDYGVGKSSLGGFLPSSFTQNFSPSWNYTRNILNEANLNLTHRFENGWTSSTTLLYRYYGYHAEDAYPFGATGSDPYLQDFYAEKQQGTYNSFSADTNISGPVHLFGRDHTLTFGASYTQVNEAFEFGGEDLGTWNVLDPTAIPHPVLSLTSSSKSDYQQGGVYGQAKIRVTDPLTVILGGREVWYQEKDQSGGDWTVGTQLNGKFVPYAGLVYDIVPTLSAYTSYSEVFAPQTGTTVTGQGIAPASGKQYEVGLKGTFLDGKLNANVAAFRIDNDHYELGDPVNPDFYVDAGKVRSQGFEAEVTGEPLPNWNVYAGYTMLDTRYLSGGDSTGQSYDLEEPHSLFKLWTSYRIQQGMLHGLLIGGGMLAQSQTGRIDASYMQGGLAIYNAQVGYQFNKHVTSSLTLNNIFDRMYYSRVPGTYFGQFGDRRNVMLTVRTDF